MFLRLCAKALFLTKVDPAVKFDAIISFKVPRATAVHVAKQRARRPRPLADDVSGGFAHPPAAALPSPHVLTAANALYRMPAHPARDAYEITCVTLGRSSAPPPS